MTARRRLQNRRPNETHDLDIGGKRFAVKIGYFEDGTPGEIFIAGARVGSELDAALSDGAILASLALQHGVTPAALARSLSRLPAGGPFDRATLPASPIGAAIDVLTTPVR